MERICKKEKCTGCFACYNSCKKNAITMIEDKNGFIHPKIDQNKCINCGLCKKICPVLNEVKKIEPEECYAAFSKDKDIRTNSTSGGIGYTLYSKFIEEKGVVYGTKFKDGKLVISRTENIDEIKKFQGSKYVHAYVEDAYLQVKKDLSEDKKVLFIATACQIAGLKRFLIKEYNNLYLVDIVCHGVPSQKYLKDEIKKYHGMNIDEKLKFRNNNDYCLKYENNNSIIIDKNNSNYLKLFLSNINIRENCLNCIYAGKDRISDLTIGDFWGLNEKSQFYKNKEKGVSIFIVNTSKGKELYEILNKDINFEKHKYSDAIKGNRRLRENKQEKNILNKIYIKTYPILGYKISSFIILCFRKIKITINKIKGEKHEQ